MRPLHLALALTITVAAWLVPHLADAGLKVVTIDVRGMVCRG